MTAFEHELRALASEVEWPETPELGPAVVHRIGAVRPRRRPGRRLSLVAAVVLVAGLASVLAVPSTRSALLRVFGVGTIEVRVVDQLPPVREPPLVAPLGRPVSIGQARAALPPLLEPDPALGAPDGVYLLRTPVVLVTFVWRDRGGIRLVVGQLDARLGKITAGKLGRDVRFLAVDGNLAIWIGGGRHHIVLERRREPGLVSTRTVLARNTLVVDRGGITLRVEGDLTQAEAVAISRRLR